MADGERPETDRLDDCNWQLRLVIDQMPSLWIACHGDVHNGSFPRALGLKMYIRNENVNLVQFKHPHSFSGTPPILPN
jgi:hypothetical protein